MKSVFAVLLMSFCGCLLEDNLIQRLCNQTSLTIDSLIRPFGTNFVYLIADNMVFKLELKSGDKSEIKSSQKLEDWDPKIRSTIHLIYTTKRDPKYLYLTNCAMKKEWIVRFEDNHYNGSADADDCGQAIEYVIDAETGHQYYLRYPSTKQNLVISHWSVVNFDWVIRSMAKNPDTIQAYPLNSKGEIHPEVESNTDIFYKINGQIISAAFIYDHYWYLFGGRYYCKVSLTTYDKCKPKPISDWIENCAPEWRPPKQSKLNSPKNKDISLYVIVVMIIIAVFLVVAIVITMLIFKHYNKKATYTQSSTRS